MKKIKMIMNPTDFWIRHFESLPSPAQLAVNKHILRDHPKCVLTWDLHLMHHFIHKSGKTMKEAAHHIMVKRRFNWYMEGPADRSLKGNPEIFFMRIVYRRAKKNK